jgi:hypothetical protein
MLNEHSHHRSLLDYESKGHVKRSSHQISASVSVESSIFRRSFMSGRHGLPLPVPSERHSMRLQIAFHVARQTSVFRRHAALYSRGHLLTFATDMQGCFPRAGIAIQAEKMFVASNGARRKNASTCARPASTTGCN